MTWKLLNWMTETSDADVPMSPILAATRSGVASVDGQQPGRLLVPAHTGIPADAARKSVLVEFMAQNGNAATDVIADTDAWSANDLKKHYNQQRLRSMVSLILLSPEFQTR